MIRRKPKSFTEPAERENYLASVSDLMAGLLFVFVILLMGFAMQFIDAKSRAEKAERESEALRSVSEKKIAELVQANSAREKVLVTLKSSLERHGIVVNIDVKNGILRLPESILFDQGKATFSSLGVQSLALASQELESTLPMCPPLEAVLIEGHTDDAPILTPYSDSLATYRDNWDLSFQRAKETFLTLVKNRPHLGELKNRRGAPLLSMSAYGEQRPVASNTSTEGQRQNRRIDIRLIIETPQIKPEDLQQ